MRDIDITDRVKYDLSDGEALPIVKCVCGNEFPSWKFIIKMDRDEPRMCRKCGRRMYFRAEIKVYEVVDGEAAEDTP